MGLVIVVWLLLAGQEAVPRAEKPHEEKPKLATVQADGIRLRYVPLPWPQEKPGAWPVGRLETSVPLRLDGRTLEPGHYALVCETLHHEGSATFEVVRLDTSDWPDAESLRHRPQGETLYRAPVRLDLAAATTPRLTITLTPHRQGITLTARYGNGRYTRDFQR